MRIPNISERMKEAPAHALRAMFAGIGQALLVSDRMRRRLRGRQAPEAASHTIKVPVATTTPATPPTEVPVGRPGTETSTSAAPGATEPAKPATTEPGPGEPGPGAKPAAAAEAAAPGSAANEAAKPTAPAAAAAKAEPKDGGASELPIPNYDQLSIPSLRARLRGLNAAQVRQLMRYEKAHGSRADVITMYERRIEKLTQTGG